MDEPNKKMTKEQYEMLKGAFKRNLKKKNQVDAARLLRTTIQAASANEENHRRRQEAKGIKPSGFPVYGKGGKMEMKEYKMGGKIYKDGGRALFEALKKKFGEG